MIYYEIFLYSRNSNLAIYIDEISSIFMYFYIDSAGLGPCMYTGTAISNLFSLRLSSFVPRVIPKLWESYKAVSTNYVFTIPKPSQILQPHHLMPALALQFHYKYDQLLPLCARLSGDIQVY